MADTLPNIKLTANQWTDLYTASGIATGTQLTIENIGETDVYIAVQQAQPLPGHNFL